MKKTNLNEFANLVLTDEKLKKYLNKKDFNKFMMLKQINGEMDFELADKIAAAIKKWALSMGATHYSHWFFPLTGKYAEKQVSFLDYGSNGEYINKFNGKALIKGETDASSFPSGGERMTFEARGYTVWDYSSPVFIKIDKVGNKVLYIPTAFCTYTGHAVDEKTPLLRAIEYMNKTATKLLNNLGYEDVTNVVCNVGCEQEYFLIDKDIFEKRTDLKFTGRTLVGSNPIKTQKTAHHYFGQISSRVSAFMHDLDKELWKLGIMAKIQHNEVAPTQHEVVPVFSPVNIATDQNSLLMEVMNLVAEKHNYKVLFHEKPYNNVNGSGKHINWSLSTNTGLNLLDFNKVEEELFMLMFTSVISAIDKHYDLLRLTTATLSNDLRLGGGEAPPSVVSVFIGEDMLEYLNSYLNANKVNKKSKKLLDIKTSSVAKMYKDNCDRNRTSPFAYTGNKFEFRMVGASQSVAFANTVILTIIANEFESINKKLENGNVKEVVKNIIVENINNHSRIIFNGNSYDKSWAVEAEKRGIKNYTNSLDVYDVLTNKNNIELFSISKILNKTELKIKYDTYLNDYINKGLIEGKTLINMCNKTIIPSINDYISNMCEIYAKSRELNINNGITDKYINDIVKKCNNISTKSEKLAKKMVEADALVDLKQKAYFVKDNVLKCINEVRCAYDAIEELLPSKFEPFPTYNEILF